MTDSIFGHEYHKIHSAFKRDMSKRGNPVIEWDWSLPEFAYLSDSPWRWTEKIDGTNTRLHWNGDTVTLGGRTDNAQIPAHLTNAVRELGLLDADLWESLWPVVNDAEPSVTLYGEGYGPKIQKGGGLYRDDVSFILFDVLIRSGNRSWWLNPADVREIANRFRIDTVPYWGTDSPENIWHLIKQGMLTSRWADRGVKIEGLVGTPEVPLYNRAGQRIVMKLKLKDWEDLERSQQ